MKIFADNQDGKWGYVDQFGNERIPHIYDLADDFIDGYAAVRQNNNWGFIDLNGKEVIPFKFNGAWSFIDGLAPVFNSDKWGFIDKNSNVKVPFKYTKISRTYKEYELVYMDENDEIINYEKEISSANSKPTNNSDSNSVESGSDVTAEPPHKQSSSSDETIESDSNDSTTNKPVVSVPVSDSMSSDVSAHRTGSYIVITVNKQLPKSMNEKSAYPFKWGFHLKDTLGNDIIGEYIVELTVSIDEEGNVLDTNSCMLLVTSPINTTVINSNLTNVNVELAEDKFIFSCDIENEYIAFEEICVNSQMHF